MVGNRTQHRQIGVGADCLFAASAWHQLVGPLTRIGSARQKFVPSLNHFLARFFIAYNLNVYIFRLKLLYLFLVLRLHSGDSLFKIKYFFLKLENRALRLNRDLRRHMTEFGDFLLSMLANSNWRAF